MEKKKKRGKLQNKLIVIFIVMLINMSIIIVISAFMLASSRTLAMYYGFAKKYSEFAAAMVEDADDLDEWIANGPDVDYKMITDQFVTTKRLFDLADLYVFYPARDENGNIVNDMTVVIDAADSSDENTYGRITYFGPSRAFDTIQKVFETGETQIHGAEKVGDSTIIVVFAPIKYAEGKVAAVTGTEIDITVVSKTAVQETAILAGLADTGILVLAIVIILFLRKNILQPVKILSAHMNKFVSSGADIVYEPIKEIHTKDEIEQMADDFNALALNIIEYTKMLEKKTTEIERHRADFDVSNKIRSVISSEMTYPVFPERSDFDLCARLGHTMDNRCSYFNYFFKDTDHLFIILGEPLGKDLSAMIFTILAICYIKSFAKMGFEPSKIALETNNQLCSIDKKDLGLTIGAVIMDIDLKNGILKYVNAGMPPVLIKKPGEMFMAEKINRPFSLGQMRGISFDQNTVNLYQGSSLVVTSFGFSETCNAKGEKYGMERLVEAANRISMSSDALDKTVKAFEEDVEKFRGDAKSMLDTAIIAFKYFG